MRQILTLVALIAASSPTASLHGGTLPVKRADGAVQIPATTDGSLQNPAFSPTDSQILFTAFVNGYNIGPADLYLFDVSSSATTLLTSVPDSDSVNLPGSSWNATLDRITFSSDREDIDEVWTIADDGSDATRVTNHSTQHRFIEPSYSSDGAWIVFEAQAIATEEGSIWKVQADGQGLIVLTDGPAGGTDDRQPNFSPTGSRIVFQRTSPGNDDWNLFTMAENGSDLRQVTFDVGGDTDASWSPDGRWLVYSSDRDGLALPEIFVIPAEGGMPIRVTVDLPHYDGAPSWSRDGQRIAFESSLGDPDASPGTTLWIIAAPLIFADGFESGDATRWSSAVP